MGDAPQSYFGLHGEYDLRCRRQFEHSPHGYRSIQKIIREELKMVAGKVA